MSDKDQNNANKNEGVAEDTGDAKAYRDLNDPRISSGSPQPTSTHSVGNRFDDGYQDIEEGIPDDEEE